MSLTMPVWLESWTSQDLHPVFRMNLPEGFLLEAIRRAIAKLVGDDDLSVLRVTGGNPVGRNRFSTPDGLNPEVQDTPESLAGTKKWWPRKMLEKFGVSHLSLAEKKMGEIAGRTAASVTEVRWLIRGYIADHPQFRETGERMVSVWSDGVRGYLES